MEQSTEIFVGIDVSKARNAIAVASDGRDGEVRSVGEVDSSMESMRRLIKRITAKPAMKQAQRSRPPLLRAQAEHKTLCGPGPHDPWALTHKSVT